MSGLVAAAVILNFLALLGWTVQAWGFYESPPTGASTWGACAVLPLAALSLGAAFLSFLTLAEQPSQRQGAVAPSPHGDKGSDS